MHRKCSDYVSKNQTQKVQFQRFGTKYQNASITTSWYALPHAGKQKDIQIDYTPNITAK